MLNIAYIKLTLGKEFTNNNFKNYYNKTGII